MKKILAITLSIVMAFTFMMPAFAADEEVDATVENSEICDSVGGVFDSLTGIYGDLEEGDYVSAATGVFGLIENIYNALHTLLHTLSEMFDFNCPFCDGKGEEAPEEAPEEVPEEPEEIFGTVTNAEEFAGANLAGGTYTVEDSIALESFLVEEGVKVNFDLKGNTVSGAALLNKGELAVNGGVVEATGCGIDNVGKAVLTDVEMNAGNDANYAAISRAGSYIEFNNFNLVSVGGGIGVTGGKAVFNSGSVAVNSTNTSGRYNFYVVGEGTELEINDGTFSFSKATLKRAYIYAGAGATVIVNGGTFGAASTRSGYTAGIMGDGTVIIKGGTFGFNPSNWVAEGYEAVKDGSVWTVAAKA